MLLNKSLMGPTSHRSCVQWPSQAGCSGIWCKTPIVCTAPATFPRAWSCSVCHQESLRCSVLCTRKHTSCLDRIQFHLEHKHLQFQEELCAPSGPGDPAYSRLLPRPTAFHMCGSFQESWGQQLHRLQGGRTSKINTNFFK